jgi:hypothetical protein
MCGGDNLGDFMIFNHCNGVGSVNGVSSARVTGQCGVQVYDGTQALRCTQAAGDYAAGDFISRCGNDIAQRAVVVPEADACHVEFWGGHLDDTNWQMCGGNNLGDFKIFDHCNGVGSVNGVSAARVAGQCSVQVYDGSNKLLCTLAAGDYAHGNFVSAGCGNDVAQRAVVVPQANACHVEFWGGHLDDTNWQMCGGDNLGDFKIFDHCNGVGSVNGVSSARVTGQCGVQVYDGSNKLLCTLAPGDYAHANFVSAGCGNDVAQRAVTVPQ